MILIFAITIMLIGLTKTSQFRLEFNKNTSSVLHSISILLVIFGHYSYALIDFGINVGWANFYGTIGCGIFLFTSGYGLIRSKQNNPIYLKGFLRKKVLQLGIPLILCSMAFQILRIAIKGCEHIYSVDQIIRGETILPTSWYAYTIILFYSVFYYLFRDANNVSDIRKSVNRLWAFSLLYIVGVSLLHWGEYWCISILSFNVGIEYFFYASKHKTISRFKILTLCLVLFLIILMWPNSVWQEDLEVYTIISQIPSRLFLAFYPMVLIPIFSSSNFSKTYFFNTISSYTYYIYLVQGAIIFFLGTEIKNFLLYLSISLLLIAVCSSSLKYLCKKVLMLEMYL